MIWRFRFPKAQRQLGGKARDRRDASPIPDEVRTQTQQQFHAWAAMVRASMETIQALAEEIRERDRALEDLFRSPTRPDPAVIDTLILEMQARRAEMQRIINALPALDEMPGESNAGRASMPPL